MTKLARSLAVLLLVWTGLVGGGALQSHVATAAMATAATVSATEDAATQVTTFDEAYNLLMDRYVHQLDSAALLSAGWDELTRAADGKASPPGAAPAFSGSRPGDAELMRAALRSYVAASDGPPGFVAAHALIRGMVHFVNEGHTYFLDPQQYRDYESWSRGDNKYVGIGISVNTRDSEPRIVEVYEDTPAQRAGLRAGDVLLRIDDRPAAGLALDEMTALVRGPAGTRVNLVVRRGESETLTFDVERAEIHLQFVRQRVLADDIGYVSLRGFPEPSVVDAIERDVAGFQAAGVRGLVLDLRGNSGGRIDVGTRLLSHFLPAGSGVYAEIDRSGENHIHTSRASAHYDLPLVVLVDGGTASMGEIFASAVQEHGAATVLGTATAGSVAAAQVFGLPDGAGLQVTVFEILSADGKPLNRVGVVPDEVVEATPTDAPTGTDAVLSRAVEILHDDSAAHIGAIEVAPAV